MANAVAVDNWSGQGVRLSDVVKALSDLRNQSSGHNAIRTAVMTLVAVAPSDEQAYPAINALRQLGAQHPARIVVVRPDPDNAATLDARATLYSVDWESHQLNFEELLLTVSGQAANHLDSVIEPFTLSDLPVAVWYVGGVPDPSDPLLSVASTLLIDSRDAASSGQLRSLLELARRRTVVDLSWIRLAPWRELLAGLFDPRDRRLWQEAVRSAEVTGKVGPRKLLGGWVASRLRLSPDQVDLRDAMHVEIRLQCERDGKTATFEVVRGKENRTVTAQALLPSGPIAGQTTDLAEDPLATSLAEALTHLEPDVVWERALSFATILPPA